MLDRNLIPWTPCASAPSTVFTVCDFQDACDSLAVLLPNGDVLVEGDSGTMYDFDGTHLTPDAAGGGSSILMLPTGQALVETFSVEVYNPKGKYQAAWAPKVTTYPHSVNRGSTYKISGKQFNGLSQAAAFGDEFETATNYPLCGSPTPHPVTFSMRRRMTTARWAWPPATPSFRPTLTFPPTWTPVQVRWKSWPTGSCPRRSASP